jgi:hypothetical protein
MDTRDSAAPDEAAVLEVGGDGEDDGRTEVAQVDHRRGALVRAAGRTRRGGAAVTRRQPQSSAIGPSLARDPGGRFDSFNTLPSGALGTDSVLKLVLYGGRRKCACFAMPY